MIKRAKDEEYSIEDAIKHNEEIERREAVPNKTSAKKTREEKPKKYINFISIDEDVFYLLSSAASADGMKFEAYCAKLLSNMAYKLDEISQSRDYKIDSMRMKAKRHYERLDDVELMAIEYNSHPSEELADIFVQICDELGVDPDELKERVKNEPMSEAIAGFRVNPNTKTSRCRRWMINMMRQNNHYVEAQKANTLGISEGFDRNMMASVRRRLGISSVPKGENGIYHWVVEPRDRAARMILGDDY